MSDPLQISPATIDALRTRHAAFLKERLGSERGRADFEAWLAAAHDDLLGRPLREVIDPQAVVAAGHAALTNEAVRGLIAPIVREVTRRVVVALRSEESKLGLYVPKDARAAIDQLLARPDLVPADLIRKILDAEVTEEIMRDVMYDALVEFNESVNPFFAEWGLPALIKRFMPIGSGAVLKSMSAVRAEFDKRLEPEMRKFLLGFSRKSKKKVADIIISSAGDPKLVALRQSVVAFFYEETLAQITQNVGDDVRATAEEAVLAIVLEVLRQERPRERLVAELEKFLTEHGSETVGAWLTRIGVTERPDFGKTADLLWPFVRLGLESPPAVAFYERVTADFYATLASTD
jgi:hypothetical protein